MSCDERKARVKKITEILLGGYNETPALRQHFEIKAGLIVDAEDRRNSARLRFLERQWELKNRRADLFKTL